MAINPSGIALNRAFKPQILIHPSFDAIARNYDRFRIPRPPEFDPEGTEPGKLCWGAVGAMPNPEPIGGTDFTVKESWNEKSRKSQKVRVENPDDPSQYVMEDRPLEVTFDKEVIDPKTGTNTTTHVKTTDFQEIINLPGMSGAFIDTFERKHTEAIMKYQVTGIQGG